jgi:hypothetical protein
MSWWMLWLTLEGLSYTDRAVVCVCCCGDRGLTKIIENVTGIETMGHLCVPIEDSDFGLVTGLLSSYLLLYDLIVETSP